MNLKTLGFKDSFNGILQEYMKADKYKNCVPARVMLEHKHTYRIAAEEGEWLASAAGKFAYEAMSREDYPAVGDWVLAEKMPGEERAVIRELFPRLSKFSRKIAGTQTAEQIVASNIDVILLVMSLNSDFNVRRLERYLVAAWDSGAVPVVVLTKADLCEDIPAFTSRLGIAAAGIDVHVVSAVTGEGMEQVRALFKEGVTGALLGSSGAGKSTLTNALYGSGVMEVSGIREDDAKGRHTTTHRELIVLPDGGCLIDTPGMRELQLWDQSDSMSAGFRDIEELAGNCRYRDCAHGSEPGCAVIMAIEEGSLEESRLHSYFKLRRELAYMERKSQQQARKAGTKKTKRKK